MLWYQNELVIYQWQDSVQFHHLTRSSLVERMIHSMATRLPIKELDFLYKI